MDIERIDMMEKENQYKLKRKLGDEWENWSGSIEDNLGHLDTSVYLFLFLFISINIAAFFALWSIYIFLFKAFVHLSPLLNHFIDLSIIGLSIYGVVYFFLLMITLMFKKPFAFFLKDKKFVDLNMTKLTMYIAAKLHFSQDKIINSMIKINNSFIKILYRSIEKEELLILVPRCLSKKTREDLTFIAEEYSVDLHIASGGTQARKILKENKPKGIIAVACERDLYSGVKDVPAHIPVIALANERPEGPCKNTLVDMDEMEKAIDFFLKK